MKTRTLAMKSREMATFTYKLTLNSFDSLHSFCFCFIKNAPISLGSAEEVLAWFWDSLSNDRLEATLDLKNNPNKIIGGNDSNNHRVFSSIKQMPYPLWPRLFVYESAWTKLSDNEFVYVWRPVGADNKYKHDDLGVGASTVRAESRGYVTIKKLGDHSCLVTYVQFVDLKVPFGAKYTKSLHHSSLSDIFSLRKTFNRDDEIDKIDRNKLVSAMIHSSRGQHDEIYTDAENSVFTRVETKLGRIIKESSFKSLASPDFRTKMGIAHVKGSASAYLKVEVVVDASIEECAAYNFMQKSREKMKMNDRKDVLFMDTRSHNSHCSDNLLVRDLGERAKRAASEASRERSELVTTSEKCCWLASLTVFVARKPRGIRKYSHCEINFMSI